MPTYKSERHQVEKIYDVHGMKCQHCEQRVAEVLRGVPGVRDAEVQIATHIATLEADADIGVDELNRHLANAGGYSLSIRGRESRPVS